MLGLLASWRDGRKSLILGLFRTQEIFVTRSCAGGLKSVVVGRGIVICSSHWRVVLGSLAPGRDSRGRRRDRITAPETRGR
jgi:hypothetical protein